MPNICNFDMKISGKKKDIERLYKMLNYDESEKYRFYRVIECFYTYEEDLEGVDDNKYISTFISGECAWSVETCMLIEDADKYEDLTSIDKVSKELDLLIEIVSEERGFNFTEHYVIDNGEILVNECNDLITKEELERYKGNKEALQELYDARSEEIINKLY